MEQTELEAVVVSMAASLAKITAVLEKMQAQQAIRPFGPPMPPRLPLSGPPTLPPSKQVEKVVLAGA
ncbi:MAG: hypothetical protein ACOYOS_00195 [Syntrophales bacterium]